MSTTYKDKILKDIEGIPEDKMPQLYRIIHLIASEFTSTIKKEGNRGTLRGLWKGSQIDESLFLEAKKSLFPYENR